MIKILKRSFVMLLMLFVCNQVEAQIGLQDSVQKTLEIPDEIISRIPEDEIARFLIARQRVIDKKERKIVLTDPFKEIGVSKEIISRIPGDELFNFLQERGYIEILAHEHISTHQNHGGPTPKELIKLLYTMIFIITGLIVLNMFLSHFRNNKESTIIIKALESQQEIPLSLLSSNRRSAYLNGAIVLVAVGIGIIIIGFNDIVPSILAAIPISIAAGYFLISILIGKGK